MLKHIILSGPGLVLLAACSDTRNDRSAGYDPCEQMKREAETVDNLERQVRDLRSRALEEEAGRSDRDRDKARKVSAESLLVQKENVLALSIQAMQQSAQDCETRSQPFDRYRTAPEREERL